MAQPNSKANQNLTRGIHVGVAFEKLEYMLGRGWLKPGLSLLDIGSSNLYSAEPDALARFVSCLDGEHDSALVEKLSAGSAYGPNGGLNESFIGPLLEHVGLTYLSLDIAPGYRTQVLDLNSQPLPQDLHGKFDLVINFGTTEHVMNQANAFEVIHDATKPGGLMIHELPILGWMEHCYITYKPRMFLDIAGANGYELVDFAYRQPVTGKRVFGIIEAYESYFPGLAGAAARQPELADMVAIDLSGYFVFRRTSAAPFKTPLELSTAVYGDVLVNTQKRGLGARIRSLLSRHLR